MIAASVGFLFVVLEPTRISALGVSIERSRRGWLLFIFLAAVLYFEFAFLAGSRADFHVWRVDFWLALLYGGAIACLLLYQLTRELA